MVWLGWFGCGDAPAESVATEPAALVVDLAVRPGLRDLVATVSGAGGARTFAWERNGAPWAGSGERVPATEVWPGDVWRVTAQAGAASGSAEATVPSPAQTNVLVVLLDDVGIDKLALYGPAVVPVPTPTIDALAAEGMTFDRAYASPLCAPTRANLLTGRYARRTGYGWLPEAGDRLPYAEVTIAEMLGGARGGGIWTSVALGKWNLAGDDVSLTHPNEQGFAHYSGVFTFMSASWLPLNDYFSWVETTDGVEVGRSDVYNTTDIVDDALAQIAVLPEPWFVYVALNAAHEPFHVPPADLHTQDVTEESGAPALQRAVLEAADTELGRLFAAMPPAVRANTTIVVTGDNGTQAEAVEPPYPTDHAKRTVYEGGAHVPLIVAGPLVAQAGSRSSALVHLIDLFPTVADIAGVPLVDRDGGVALPLDGGGARAIDGVSLVPYLLDPSTPSLREVLYVEQFSPNGPPPYPNIQVALRTATHTLVRIGDEDELYVYAPGGLDGPNLLDDGETPEEEEIRRALSEALTAEIAALPYEELWDSE